MPKTETCRGACGRRLPKDEEHFQHRAYASGREWWDDLCRPCRRKKDLPNRLAARARRRAALAARKTVVCRGPCGKEKPYTDQHFRRRGDKKLLPTTCRVCDRARIEAWRASPLGRAMDRDRRRLPTPASRAKNREAARRWRQREKVLPGRSAKNNALSRLRGAIERGELERPAACSRCRTTRRRITALLLAGTFPGPVRWLCSPCRYLEEHPEVTLERREVGRDLRGIRAVGDPLRALTVPREEWLAIHRACVRAIEAEEGPVDQARERARAAYREAFRGTALSRGCEERLRRALAIQPEATTG